ncbi:ABC transporter ATP-binding protein [Poseidonocella sp. HB161398]|uniref:ABC transporter ATP-binding protein n=1 Tax=Poseidonocella sp. HB161398 TaxID=2320855 RepID=UPI001109CF83|nr:ABC transporter ATP-binding protein [Poseidonocella sp. HB161398]
MTAAPILSVRGLATHFDTPKGTVRAVDGVSFDVPEGRTLGIVGESGSGKSVTSLSVMGLIDPPGRIAAGEILFRGRDLAQLSERERQSLRGQSLCLVFQDPMAALNPVYRIGRQVEETILAHHAIPRREAAARAVELLRMVGIPDPEARAREFPHNLSGGMRQRVTIAMAMANKPDLLILDEPTTALDVTIQAQILDLVRGLTGTTVMLITHDIGVVREMCDEVVVMYGGRIMEHGPVAEITRRPRHPYTAGLLASLPSGRMRGQRLQPIAGSVPSPHAMPPGCPFAPRCPQAMARCAEAPPMAAPAPGHRVACWLEETVHG